MIAGKATTDTMKHKGHEDLLRTRHCVLRVFFVLFVTQKLEAKATTNTTKHNGHGDFVAYSTLCSAKLPG